MCLNSTADYSQKILTSSPQADVQESNFDCQLLYSGKQRFTDVLHADRKKSAHVVKAVVFVQII